MPKLGMINYAGASEGRVAPIMAEKIKENKGQSLIVVPTLNRAKRLATDLSFFGAPNILVLPPEEEGFLQYEARSNDELLQRIAILKEITSGADCTVIAPVTGAIRKLPPKEVFLENRIFVKRGEDLDLENLKQDLARMGYERVSMIESRGEYSQRGEIIDIFTPEGEMPYRIDLFDTEVDSIKTFDPDTQRSIEELTDITIYPCTELLRDSEAFAKAAQKIERAYNRRIRTLEKRAAEKAKAEAGSGQAGQAMAASEIKTEQTYNLRQRRDQLIEYADGMINLQYMEKFLGYFYDSTAYIWDFMDSPQIFVDDPARILQVLELFEKERADDIDMLL